MRSKLDRRAFLRLSGGVGALSLLAACGGQEPAAPTDGAENPAPTAADVAAAGPGFKGEIEFWDWEFPPRNEAMQRLIGEWQAANAGATLKYTTQGWDDLGTKLLAAATAGSAPPFSNVHSFWRPELQRAGVLAPYPDEIFDLNALWSTPFNRDPQTGKVYTSDFCLYTDALFYNKELLEKQGIKAADLPKKWDDFMKLAEQLTVRDGSGKLTQAGWTFNHYYSREWLWATLVYQQGGFLYNEAGDAAIWNSEEGVRALQLIQDVYHKHKVDDPEFLGMFDAFGNAQAATYISQGYTGAGTDTEYPQIAGKWATTTTPTYSGGPTPAWGLVTPEEGFCVFAKTPPEQQDAAFSFIKYMIGSPERRQEWAAISAGPPDAKDQAVLDLLAKNDPKNLIGAQAATLPYRINYGERPLEAEQIWRVMFDEVILEKGDPKAALDKATESMNAALKSSGKRRVFTERSYKAPQA